MRRTFCEFGWEVDAFGVFSALEHVFGGIARGLSSARGEYDFFGDFLPGFGVSGEEGRDFAFNGVDDPVSDFDVAEAPLCLALELRVCDEEADGRIEPRTDVVGHDGDVTRDEVVRFHVVASGADDAFAHGGLVCAAVGRGDGVGETLDLLAVGIGPAECDVDAALRFIAFERANFALNHIDLVLSEHVRDEVAKPAIEAESFFRLRDAVVVDDFEPLENVGFDFESLADEVGIEVDIAKDFGIGAEKNRRATDAARSDAFDARKRLPLAVALLIDATIALDVDAKIGAQGIDDARTDAVEPARRLIIVVVKFAAGVQLRENDLQHAFFGLRVDVDGDAAAVVGNGQRASVFV